MWSAREVAIQLPLRFKHDYILLTDLLGIPRKESKDSGNIVTVFGEEIDTCIFTARLPPGNFYAQYKQQLRYFNHGLQRSKLFRPSQAIYPFVPQSSAPVVFLCVMSGILLPTARNFQTSTPEPEYTPLVVVDL